MKVYVASSWRNPYQPAVVEFLRGAGHEVYDFRTPSSGGPEGAPDHGFSWAEIDSKWKSWSPSEYRHHLKSPTAQRGFVADRDALIWCDACLLVQPCGRSAHLELGYAAGMGKVAAIYFPEGAAVEPELMALLADWILIGERDLALWAGLGRPAKETAHA